LPEVVLFVDTFNPHFNPGVAEAAYSVLSSQFGLESEHAGYSLQMAEQELYPALRAKPMTAVIANGFSCQQQILNGGFRKPRQIAEVLYAALDRRQ
jgi:glycerol-3-phosphate dehydrogenase subunit C